MPIHTNKAIDLSPWIELTKPRISTLVVVTTALSFWIASEGAWLWWTLIATLTGTYLSSAGAATLNHLIERDTDARMPRTAQRPIVTGRVTPAAALSFGILLTLAGVFLLTWQVNLLTAFLSLLSAFLYVAVYTPLKKVTWLNTSLGAVPGALPALGGWTAATGDLAPGAWILFLIMFLWQHPHFYAIAWMYKDDYTAGGLRMLSNVDPSGKRLFRHSVVWTILLVGVSLFPAFHGMAGTFYFNGALILGSIFLAAALNLSIKGDRRSALLVLKASVFYLPLIFGLILIDARFGEWLVV